MLLNRVNLKEATGEMINQITDDRGKLALSKSHELVEIFESQVAALGRLFAGSGYSS